MSTPLLLESSKHPQVLSSDSEYILDLIRREQERSAEIDAIRSALIEGENSGEPRRFDDAAFKQKMLAAHG